jgi:hypothetical protein
MFPPVRRGQEITSRYMCSGAREYHEHRRRRVCMRRALRTLPAQFGLCPTMTPLIALAMLSLGDHWPALGK